MKAPLAVRGTNTLVNMEPLRNILSPAKCPAVTMGAAITLVLAETGMTTALAEGRGKEQMTRCPKGISI